MSKADLAGVSRRRFTATTVKDDGGQKTTKIISQTLKIPNPMISKRRNNRISSLTIQPPEARLITPVRDLVWLHWRVVGLILMSRHNVATDQRGTLATRHQSAVHRDARDCGHERELRPGVPRQCDARLVCRMQSIPRWAPRH